MSIFLGRHGWGRVVGPSGIFPGMNDLFATAGFPHLLGACEVDGPRALPRCSRGWRCLSPLPVSQHYCWGSRLLLRSFEAGGLTCQSTCGELVWGLGCLRALRSASWPKSQCVCGSHSENGAKLGAERCGGKWAHFRALRNVDFAAHFRALRNGGPRIRKWGNLNKIVG